MDLRRISGLSALLGVLLIHQPLAWGQQAGGTPAAPVAAAAAAPVNPPIPTFATLWREYERRFLIASSKGDHIAMTYIGFDAPRIAESVLGSNWNLVREEALRLLNGLPVYDTASLDAQKWAGEYNDIFEELAKPTPAHLASARMFSPTLVLNVVTMSVVQRHIPQEQLRDAMLIASAVGANPYRATWRGKTALVVEYGHYLIAMEYMLTKEGMFLPVRAAIARRQL